jgi:adenosylmethionine-8-amino-7-oxononanoate aminotransferase
MMSLQEKDRQYLWHPYTQMKDYAERDLLIIDRADGLRLIDEHGRSYFDTVSSWWCILHGHNHPTIKAAIKKQLDKVEQVLLAGTSHEAAILLAEQLVGITPPNLTKVFYSDNGSTACEIAFKMSIQYWRHVGHPERNQLVALERGYHGDTIGTMSLGGTPEFHGPFNDMLFDSHRLPSPYCFRCPQGLEQASCDCECLQPYVELLAKQGEQIAALILEPLIQAAGGMIIYPAKYLKKIVALSKEHGVHLIFDEVATGFGRTGTMFAMEQAEVVPDFLCLSKGLTAGCLPMAATMTSDEIYQAFYGDYQDGKTFFHGHTFTGNPVAAAAGLGSLQVFAEEKTMDGLPAKISRLHSNMARFAELPWVGDLRQLGMISAMELVKDEAATPYGFNDRVGWPIYLAGLKEGVLLRPMGNVMYLWLPLSATIAEIDEICERVWRVLSDPENIVGW